MRIDHVIPLLCGQITYIHLVRHVKSLLATIPVVQGVARCCIAHWNLLQIGLVFSLVLALILGLSLVITRPPLWASLATVVAVETAAVAFAIAMMIHLPQLPPA